MNDRSRRPLARLAPIVIGIGGALLIQHFYGSHPVELLVSIPAEQDSGAGIDLRLTRQNDPRLVLEVEEPARTSSSHTVVIRTKLARGRYELRAWLNDAKHTAFAADFAFAGQEELEVNLAPR